MSDPIEIPLELDFDNRPLNEVNNIPLFPGMGVSFVGPLGINVVRDSGYLVARPPLVEVTIPTDPLSSVFSDNPTEIYGISNTNKVYYSQNGGTFTVLGTVAPGISYVPAFASASLQQNVMWNYGYVGTGHTLGYYRNGVTFGQITDVNFTGYNTLDSAVYLDGTYYVMTPDGSIYGSNFNDPTVWNPLNRINAWQDSSLAISLFKHRSYVVALKQASMQVFYDAGNPTGSPLAAYLAAQQPVGTTDITTGDSNSKTLTEIRGDHFWVARSKDSTVFVAHMSNLVIDIVSTPGVNRWLDWNLRKGNSLQGSKMTFWGQAYYCIANYTGLSGSDSSGVLYNIATKEWSFFEGPAIGAIRSQCFGSGFGDSILADTYYTGYYAGTPRTFKFVTTGYKNNLSVNQIMGWADNFVGINPRGISSQFTSRIIDGGTQAEKTAMRLEVFSDNQDGGILEIAWSDDDYKSWSGYRQVSLTSPRVFTDDLGTFRRRAFRIRHMSQTPMRIQSIKLHVLIGSS